METRAIAKMQRTTPRKVRLVLDLIRGKKLADAINILNNVDTKAAGIIKKVVMSAAANAENNHSMNLEELYVSKTYACEGPTLKRIRPRAQGRASEIKKRTSHITVVLSDQKF